MTEIGRDRPPPPPRHPSEPQWVRAVTARQNGPAAGNQLAATHASTLGKALARWFGTVPRPRPAALASPRCSCSNVEHAYAMEGKPHDPRARRGDPRAQMPSAHILHAAHTTAGPVRHAGASDHLGRSSAHVSSSVGRSGVSAEDTAPHERTGLRA